MKSTVLLTAALLAMSSPAFATYLTDPVGDYGSCSSHDACGGKAYDIVGMNISRNATQATFRVDTYFEPNAWITYGDLRLDTNLDGTWDVVFDTDTGKVYRSPTMQTAFQAIGSGAGRPDLEVRRATGGTELGSFSFSHTADGVLDSINDISYTVNLDVLGWADDIAPFAAAWTMTCGNDEIKGLVKLNRVPEPSTLSLLGLGLGLLAWRRRKSPTR